MSAIIQRLTSFLPIQDKQLFDLLQRAKATFWTEDEIDMSTDLHDWTNKLNDNERAFLGNILGFFVQSDQLVNINLGDRFLQDIEEIPKSMSKYAKLFYNFQTAIEDIHTLTYETLLFELIKDPIQHEHYKRSIETIPAVSKKAAWAVKYIEDKDSSFMIRLIAFAILEGIFFSGSFCAIFWIGERNILKGLVQSNRFISRDENLHYEFALTLFKKLRDQCSEPGLNDVIREMVKSAVDIESEFICDSIPCSMIGMNSVLMTQYIQFVADRLMEDIELDTIYNVSNPFDFMVMLGIPDKANFFENRETVYQKATAGTLDGYSSSDDEF